MLFRSRELTLRMDSVQSLAGIVLPDTLLRLQLEAGFHSAAMMPLLPDSLQSLKLVSIHEELHLLRLPASLSSLRLEKMWGVGGTLRGLRLPESLLDLHISGTQPVLLSSATDTSPEGSI